MRSEALSSELVNYGVSVNGRIETILTKVHPDVESIQKTVDEVSDNVARVKGKVVKQG